MVQRQGPHPLQRRLRLGLVDDAGDRVKLHSKRLARPVQQRRPSRPLARHQLLGLVCEIGQHVGAGEARQVGGDLLPHLRRAVERRIGQPGCGHGRDVDPFVLRRPLAGDQAGEGEGRQLHPRPRGRADRPSVEQDVEALLGRRGLRGLVEAARLLRRHRLGLGQHGFAFKNAPGGGADGRRARRAQPPPRSPRSRSDGSPPSFRD